MLIAAFVFLPVVIVLVMSRILGGLLLSEGDRSKIAAFFVVCVAIYAGLMILIAQVDNL